MSTLSDAAEAASPSLFRPLREETATAPRLCVVVDTEEEFDWSAPFSRENVDVSAIAEVGRLQTVVGRYGLRPTYVIDYPVASTPSSALRMAEMAARGECHIGAHLHPWVNPPYVERVETRNSYACNLGPELEGNKISELQSAIATNVGVDARSYKAGRYGFAASTARILERLGFDIDLSVNPHMNFTGDGGPSFEGFTPAPSVFGSTRQLLEVPCTTGFVGAARHLGAGLHRAVSARWLEPFRAVGVLAKSGLLNRVMLSPEGNTLDEMQQLTDRLLADGLRTFSLTLHSPSLKPGCTPYVRSVEERDAFLKTIDRYCEYFMKQHGGVPSTPVDVFNQMEGRAA
jgi:hypothetical protein